VLITAKYSPFIFSLNENLEDFKTKARLCVEKSLEEFDKESLITSGNGAFWIQNVFQV
jgi:hypothetical protein